MLRKVLTPEYRYITFDDPLVVEYFLSDPRAFLAEYGERVIFDEVQRVPALFNHLKVLIDNDRDKYGNFVLTGSSQFSMVKGITESLAGRIGSLSLLPFQYSEIPAGLRDAQMLLGSYPENVARGFGGVRDWYSAYIGNYLERDVRSLFNIGNLRDFQRLLSLLASQTAQELNMSRLAGDIGVTVKTIGAWISILEASFIIFLVPPYHRNLGKRVVKRPKLYFYDTGLVCHLTGVRTAELLEKGPLAGPVFENYVAAELKKAVLHGAQDITFYYYRNNSGTEADLIIDDLAAGSTVFVEIKCSSTARPGMVEGLRKLIALERESSRSAAWNVSGVLVFRGDETPDFGGIRAVNYRRFLEEFLDTEGHDGRMS